jgi:hypothetical protein
VRIAHNIPIMNLMPFEFHFSEYDQCDQFQCNFSDFSELNFDFVRFQCDTMHDSSSSDSYGLCVRFVAYCVALNRFSVVCEQLG